MGPRGDTTPPGRPGRPGPRGGPRAAVAAVLALLVGLAACSATPGLRDEAGATDPGPTVDSQELASGVNPEGTDPLPPLPDEVALPLVFVHGFAGSAQQYESQAQRFAANGYPQRRIVAFEHDGAGLEIARYAEELHGFVEQTRAEFSASQVYLVGHSRGTQVVSQYLTDPERAASVAKVVALDGAPCPPVVPCLGITRADLDGQGHVEVATSPDSFDRQYEFLVGEPPEVTDLVPQRAPIEIAGRAVDFPANRGRRATLEIWRVDPASGQRVDPEPHARVALDDQGGFGPVRLGAGQHYEYVLSADDSPVQHHLYLQPYVRSSYLVRLLTSEPDGAIRRHTATGPDRVALIAIRMREWYAEGDGGAGRDVLTVSYRGAAPLDVLPARLGDTSIGLHLHDDDASPGRTTLDPLPFFGDQPFQGGVDVHLPADPDASGTISVTNLPRGDAGRPQTINVANWPSDRHVVSVVFTDHPVA